MLFRFYKQGNQGPGDKSLLLLSQVWESNELMIHVRGFKDDLTEHSKSAICHHLFELLQDWVCANDIALDHMDLYLCVGYSHL